MATSSVHANEAADDKSDFLFSWVRRIRTQDSQKFFNFLILGRKQLWAAWIRAQRGHDATNPQLSPLFSGPESASDNGRGRSHCTINRYTF